MMQKRTIYSLLLTSLLLVCAFSLASAQNTVTFQSTSVARCTPAALNVTVNPAADISAFEIVFEVSSTSGGAFFDAVNVAWDPGLVELTNRIVDLGGVDNVSPDTIRIAGMLTDAGDVCLAAGPTVVAQVQFTVNDVCSGTIGLSGATFACATTPVVAVTQFVDCATTALVAATVTAGTVTVNNQAPLINPIADATLHWGSVYLGQIVAVDADLANGCEALSYSLVSGPAAMVVNPATGKITWATTGADVCTHAVEVAVTDECGAQATTTFDICVYNDAPVAVCPTDTMVVGWGDLASGTVSGTDPDMGPYALNYSVVNFSGPGSVIMNPATGEWSWQTGYDPAYTGIFELQVAVSDGANVCVGCSPNNADSCSIFIRVVPFLITIEKTHGTYQGGFEEVSITTLNDDYVNYEMGGFDFLIQYDPTALTLQAALPGQFIEDCGWEYFTYRYGANGNCGPGACPTGIVRVVAIAETNNGANHPDCFTTGPTVSNELVKLSFLVTNDRTFECMYVPIRFIWYDCGDNGISSRSGDTLFISRHIYDYPFDLVGGGPFATPIEDLSAEFPTLFGAQEECDTQDKTIPLRLVDFQNGGIDIVCADSIDARGDINMNGMGYEIADAVLYSNYFVYGVGVFDYYQAQVAASDVNADGIPLSVADLVYLIRVIVGDAQPYVKAVPAEVSLVNSRGTLSVNGEVLMGAAFLTVSGNVTPTLLATNMEMKYAYNATENLTRVLVYSMQAEGFTGEFVSVPGELVSLELATYDGYPVVFKQVPTDFVLEQNYPNPFNPSTTISFGLPVASAYTLTIYNVQGQVVKVFSGQAEAGMVDLTWEAGSNASGIYLYRLDAGTFSQTKKMVLLK